MSRLDRGQELVTAATAACLAAGLTKVIVTLDPRQAPSGYNHGFIFVVPPRLEFTTWTETTETWTLHVAAGPWDDAHAAWRTLDAIIEALRAANINLASGEPAQMQVASGEPPMPGYVLELTPDPVTD